MKTLVVGLVLFSVPFFRATPSPRRPLDLLLTRTQKGGRWYLAENGHAVYCLGPVITVNTLTEGPRRVATYCRGEKPLVPLKD